MIPVADLVVPKNTPATAPASVLLRPVRGYIARVLVRAPDGCAGLVGLRLRDRGSQFLPTFGWLLLNDTEYGQTIGLALQGPPFEVWADAYNLDDTYSHSLQIRIEG